LRESFLSNQFLELNGGIDISFREIPAHIFKEKVPLRPIAILSTLQAKEFAERGKLGSV